MLLLEVQPLHHPKHGHQDLPVIHSIHPFGFAGHHSLRAEMSQKVIGSQIVPE